MFVLILSLVITFTISFLSSLAEGVILSLTPGQLADLEHRHPRIGEIWRGFKAEIDKPITVILTLNTVAHTVGSTVAGSRFALLFENNQNWIAAFSIVFTYVMLQFTEILPKALGVQFNARVAFFLTYPILILVKLMTPLVQFLHAVNKLFIRKSEAADGAETVAEINALAGAALISKQIGAHQEKIITGTTRLSKLNARDVMIPLEQITFLSSSHSLADAIVKCHLDPHTRFPVIKDDDKNEVLGYVNFKELVYRVRTNPADPTLRGIIRPITFIDPATPCSRILCLLVDEHVHIAIVRDGRTQETVGLLTMEDLVEELVGDIEDEFDKLPRMFQPLAGGVWIVGGGIAASELFNRVNLPAEPTKENISQWVIRRFGAVPGIGEILSVGDKDITIRRMRRGKVFEILVTPRGLAPTKI